MALTADEQAELDAIKASFTSEDEEELQALRASQGPSEASTQRAGLNPAYNQPMQVSPTTFHEGGTLTRSPGLTALGTERGEIISTPEYSAQDLERRTSALKETLTRDAPVATGSIAGTLIGGALGGIPGAAIGDVLGSAAGYFGARALQGKPFDLKDALITLGPTALVNAYSGVVRPPPQALVRSSKTGRQAQVDVRNAQTQAANTAADEAVAAFNANAQAELALAQEKQAMARARTQGQFHSEMESYNALLAQRAAEKQREAEILRGMQLAQRHGNVAKIGEFAAQMLPVVPSQAEVEGFYAQAQQAAERYGVPVVFPELQKVRKDLLAESTRYRKGLGQTPLSRNLKKLGTAGGETGELTLQEVQATLAQAKENAADQARTPLERRAYTRIVEATEEGLEKLAERSDLPNDFRFHLKLGIEAYKRRKSHAELTRFVMEDAAPYGADGVRGFSAPVALKKLEDKSHTEFRNYLKKTILADSPETLYTRLKATLETMASADSRALEQQRQLVRDLRADPPGRPFNPVGPTGLEPLPLKPQAPTQPQAVPQPLEAAPRPGLLATLTNIGTRAGLTVGAAALGGKGQYLPMGLALAGAAGLPQAVAALMMTDLGHKTLLALVRAQGTRFTPAMTGLVTAAARSMLEPAVEPVRSFLVGTPAPTTPP